jgi:hypothetical protein
MKKEKSGCFSGFWVVVGGIASLIAIYVFVSQYFPASSGCGAPFACTVPSSTPENQIFKDWAVTLDCQKTVYTYKGTTANSGDVFIILDVKVKNNSNSSQELHSSLFEIDGSNGYPYYEDKINNPDRPLQFALNEEQTLRMVFQVKEDDHQLVYKFLGNPAHEWPLPYKSCSTQ